MRWPDDIANVAESVICNCALFVANRPGVGLPPSGTVPICYKLFSHDCVDAWKDSDGAGAQDGEDGILDFDSAGALE